jgi:hypothetical protein
MATDITNFDSVVLPDNIKLLGTGKQFLAANLDSVMMIVWTRPPDVQAFEIAEPYVLQMSQRFSSGYVVLVIALTSQAPAAPKDTNVRSALVIKRGGAALKGVANYFAGGDIKGKLIALSMNVIAVLSAQVPQKAYDDLPLAAGWMDDLLKKANAAHPTKEQIVDGATRLISAVRTGARAA